MGTNYEQLNCEERTMIQLSLEQGCKLRAIARECNRGGSDCWRMVSARWGVFVRGKYKARRQSWQERKSPVHICSSRKKHPEYFGAVEALGSAVQQAGPLDETVTQLVQLGDAAAIRSEGAVHSHVRRALAAGVSAGEIHHALMSVTSTIGFPNVMAALSWADDVIGNEKSGKKRSR